MKRLKLLGVMLVAMCAMGLMATSAFALPDISVTLGGTYPLHLNYEEATNKTKLENVNGAGLEGTGLKVLYLIGQLTALGTFRAIFSNVVREGEKCLNTGTAGEVLTEGSFHIVYTSLAGSTQGLQLGTLFLVTALEGATATATSLPEIKCPGSGLNTKVKAGSLIGTINGGGATNTTQITGIKGKLHGVNGKSDFRAFWNDTPSSLLAQLLCNISGTGFKECNEVVEGEPEAVALESKMFVISSR